MKGIRLQKVNNLAKIANSGPSETLIAAKIYVDAFGSKNTYMKGAAHMKATSAKKTVSKKDSAKKTASKKTASKKPSAKKTTAKKTATKKTPTSSKESHTNRKPKSQFLRYKTPSKKYNQLDDNILTILGRDAWARLVKNPLNLPESAYSDIAALATKPAEILHPGSC